MSDSTANTIHCSHSGMSTPARPARPTRASFSEAISLQVFCKTQKEIDYYWEKLGAGGDPKARQCGWLKDKYGLSWQVVPESLIKMLKDPKSKAYERVFNALLAMKKIDIARLKKAYAG